MKMDRHHLLEIILWPNEDGTFREIRNSVARLKELGIYNDWKLCIEIPHGEHTRLHKTGSRHHLFGKSTPQEVCKKLSMALRGKRLGEENPAWKGDKVGKRALRLRKEKARGHISASRLPENRKIRRELIKQKQKALGFLGPRAEVRPD